MFYKERTKESGNCLDFGTHIHAKLDKLEVIHYYRDITQIGGSLRCEFPFPPLKCLKFCELYVNL